MQKIADYGMYTELMTRGFYDKLFFVDKLFGDWHKLIDYGCADGTLTRMIKGVFPDKSIMGYDRDPTMVEEAREKHGSAGVTFTASLGEARGDVLYLSSIIHEVYSYCSDEQIDEFWDYVFRTDFKQIVVRDMVFDEDIERDSDINSVRKIYNWCHQESFHKYLKEFECINGKITNFKNLLHFLLKHEYVANWNREVRENYLPLSVQTFYNLIPACFRVDYVESYTLPYLKHLWEKKFGLFIDEKIHSKFIIRRL